MEGPEALRKVGCAKEKDIVGNNEEQNARWYAHLERKEKKWMRMPVVLGDEVASIKTVGEPPGDDEERRPVNMKTRFVGGRVEWLRAV